MKSTNFWAVITAAMLAVPAVRAFATDVAGAVYTMTNAADNAVVVFDRDAAGHLTEVATVSTGGSGSGDKLDPLASQAALVLTENHQWLLAVNAGSNEISVFRVRDDGLQLTDKVGSGGLLPTSLTVDHGLVYVLNAGDPANIMGFHLTRRGQLIPIGNSTRSLGNGAFSQVAFANRPIDMAITANGQFLYALDPADGAIHGAIHGWRIDRQDGLINLGVVPSADIAIYAQGVASW